ncbi:MAG: SPOR domain-containing protein [Bacteroidetes bacterium]|nr:SPOR domain-containing protein [Bacteroidota bacterium]
MNSIDSHISALLYDHDCVIVPSLGGFLASQNPSRIHVARQIIDPPFRKVAFNIYLRQNDGLLANHLVEFEQVSYSEARIRIEQYVNECFSKLSDGKKVIVERVGTLVYDSERNIQFEPFRQVNYLKDSFGLSPVPFAPIEREKTQAPVLRQKEKSELRPSLKDTGRTLGKKRKNAQRYLGVITVAGALAWFSLNLYLVAPRPASLTTISPFDKESLKKILTDTGLHSQELTITPPAPNVTHIETVYVASTAPASTIPQEEEIDHHPAVTAPEIIHAAQPQPSFYVIAGVFRIPENANDFVSKLQQNGYPEARIIDQGKAFYVCYNGFPNRTAALALLDSLTEKQQSGWIWHN